MKSNPGFLAADDLIRFFCVRIHEYTSIIEMLRECEKNSNPHRLVIGPRGSGKSSLLLRVAAEIRRDPDLSKSLFPVVFAEESYGVSTADEFWLEALWRLAEQAPSAEGHDLHRTFEELRMLGEGQMLGSRCLAPLLDFSNREGKRLLLIVENLNMMFRDMADPDAGWKLRQVLQTEPQIILLASATSRFDEIDDPDRALYDLFVTRTLRPLCPEECAVLWESVSGQHRSPEALRGLKILTGGNVRLLSIVAHFGARLSFRDLMADLLQLIDDLTEYFKSHIESLPAQERRVYLALADLWEPATAREVAGRARLDTSKCSAQLNRLVDRGVVEVVGGGARRKLYYLSERLYNIYCLLRRSRTPSPLIEALVRFMDAYYSPPQLMDVASRMVSEAAGLQSDLETLHWTAFARLIDLPALAPYRNELLSVSPWVLSEPDGVRTSGAKAERVLADTPDPLAPASMEEASRIVGAPERPWLTGESHKESAASNAAIRAESAATTVRTLLQKMAADSSLSGPADVARAILRECNSFLLMGRPDTALAACNEVVRRYCASDEAGVRLQVARALVGKVGAVALVDRARQVEPTR